MDRNHDVRDVVHDTEAYPMVTSDETGLNGHLGSLTPKMQRGPARGPRAVYENDFSELACGETR